MTKDYKNELLGKIEDQIIKELNFIREEKKDSEYWLKTHEPDEIALHALSWNQGCEQGLITAINILRKYYDFRGLL